MPYFAANADKFTIKYTAENGQAALDVLQAGDTDIVLTDIRMPVMNGIDLLKEIKRKGLCKCTILLSEYSDFAYAKEGIINGAFDYIVKPVDNETLRETFDRAFAFLQSVVEDDAALMSSVGKLAEALLGHDEIFRSILAAISKHINRLGSFEEKVTVICRILEQVKNRLLRERAYLDDYMPLEKICTIANAGSSAEELRASFESRIRFIYTALEKFNFSASNKLVHDICVYIVKNNDRPCGNKEISDIFCLSQKYLSTLFKKETGISFVNFVTIFKIERAKMLLSYSDMKIYQIADALRFCDKDYFSRVFKKQTGLTPRSFNWDAYLEKNTGL
jgi:two-component system response regulator YesN